MLEFFATNVLSILVTGGAGLTAILGFVKWYLTRQDKQAAAKKRQDRGRIPDMFDAFNRLYNAMRIPVDTHGATRVVLKKASNGGGVPRVGSPFYVSAVAEELGYGVAPVRAHWERRAVDDHYIRILAELVTNGHTDAITAQLPASSPLRDTYLVSGVGHSDMWMVTQTGKEMYYISVHFATAVPDSPAYREAMRQVVTECREIIDSEIAAVGDH